MRCSVVFGVTLRLLVINISSFSSAIITAAYYKRCVITCETVAVHRRPRLQHLPVAALTQAIKPDICSESRFLPIPPAFDAPVRGGGVPVRRNIAMPFDMEILEWRGHPKVRKFWWYIYLFWHDPRTWQTHGRTDRQTPHDDTGRACIASRGKIREKQNALWQTLFLVVISSQDWRSATCALIIIW